MVKFFGYRMTLLGTFVGETMALSTAKILLFWWQVQFRYTLVTRWTTAHYGTPKIPAPTPEIGKKDLQRNAVPDNVLPADIQQVHPRSGHIRGIEFVGHRPELFPCQ